MSKLLLTFLSLVSFWLFSGCALENDPYSTISERQTYSFNLFISEPTITGCVGDVKTSIITAKFRNEENHEIPDREVLFTIVNPTPFKGSITQRDSLTDMNGEIIATYRVVLSEQLRSPNNRIMIQVNSQLEVRQVGIGIEILD